MRKTSWLLFLAEEKAPKISRDWFEFAGLFQMAGAIECRREPGLQTSF